jgi:hypothetical protein
MNSKTKELVSVLLPLSSVFVIFTVIIILRVEPTGFAGYMDETLYRLNGSIAISLEQRIPADSYLRVRIDRYVINVNIIDFLKRSGKSYKVYEGEVIAEGRYIVGFDSLGITQSFRKGKHKIKVEIVHEGSVLYRSEEVIEI